MPRAPRILAGGVIYHLINRAVSGQNLFEQAQDYRVFLGILTEGKEFIRQKTSANINIYTLALMPNHWHLVAMCDQDKVLSNYLKWVAGTHTQRTRFYRQSVGRGHLYQGRFKSFPVADDSYFITLCRYVEANPIRAGLSRNADGWPWTGLSLRKTGSDPVLAEWPLACPGDWEESLESLSLKEDVSAIQRSIKRGNPYGPEGWTKQISHTLGLEQTLKSIGRPQNSS